MKRVSVLAGLAAFPAAVVAQVIPTFPMMMALDQGFFVQAGVNVVPIIHNGSSQIVLPELARRH